MRAIHSNHLYELVISVFRGMRTSSGQTPAHGVDTIESKLLSLLKVSSIYHGRNGFCVIPKRTEKPKT